jgi:hypothetical protein
VLWEDSFKSGKAKAPPSLTSFILWVLFFPFYFFHSRRCCELWSISLSLWTVYFSDLVSESIAACRW